MTKVSIIERLVEHPFIPHSALKNAHAQTLAGHFIPRRFRMVDRRPEPRVFDTAPGVRVLTHCSWQEDRLSKATLILV
ncbi:MAG TPA: hypothetical protein VLM38_10635, partial [Blastocatellia bacterium]|nr:hypothetical protein [Blastocatellia bacterium]